MKKNAEKLIDCRGGAHTTCLFCCSSGQVRSSCGLVYTGTKVRRDGGAHTNLTTASSVAGKGLVTLALFPTTTSSTWEILSRKLSCWLNGGGADTDSRALHQKKTLSRFHSTETLQEIPPALPGPYRLPWPSAGYSCELRDLSDGGSRWPRPRLSGCRRTLRALKPTAEVRPQTTCL